MIRTLLFTVLLSACAVDPDRGDGDQRIDSRSATSAIAVSACSYCHASFTIPFDNFTGPRGSTPHAACAGNVACAAAHAEAPAANLSGALDRPCEDCHAFVTR